MFKTHRGFYKKENKNNLGYVLGVLHKGFLTDLSEKISNLATLFEAERTMVMGYSMGGFGAFQLGGFAPDVFDVVVSAAGYGLGTLTPQGEMYDAPQPQATNNFEDFLGQVASNMVRVPIVLALHAEHDGMSSYRDVKAIIARLQVGPWDVFSLFSLSWALRASCLRIIFADFFRPILGLYIPFLGLRGSWFAIFSADPKP